jgi:hypothetical protein
LVDISKLLCIAGLKMAKLTDTTNDQLARGALPFQQANQGNGAHIVAAHEPLAGEPTQYSLGTAPLDLGFRQIPITQSTPDGVITQAIPAGTIIPPVAAQPLKVALVGTAPSSRMLAPYNDPTWKIWACSPGNMGVLPRYDAWFEIHGSLLWPENKHYGEPYIKFLSELKVPVYMQDKRYCQNATPLPMEELVQEFGPYYFTSSFSWMLAMAMREGAKEIMLFGIDMASRDEYILQRPGAYHFFNEARKRGIKISAPYESDIMQPPGLYGFSEVTPFGRKLIARTQELKDRLTAMRQQRDGLSHSITYLEGALEDIDYVTAIWGGVQNNSGLDVEKSQGDSNG